MVAEITLSPASVEAVAARVAELMRAKPESTDNPLLTAKQVCEYLGVSRTTLWSWCKSEVLLKPATEHPLRWTRQQLETFKLAKSGAVIRAAASTAKH